MYKKINYNIYKYNKILPSECDKKWNFAINSKYLE